MCREKISLLKSYVILIVFIETICSVTSGLGLEESDAAKIKLEQQVGAREYRLRQQRAMQRQKNGFICPPGYGDRTGHGGAIYCFQIGGTGVVVAKKGQERWVASTAHPAHIAKQSALAAKKSPDDTGLLADPSYNNGRGPDKRTWAELGSGAPPPDIKKGPVAFDKPLAVASAPAGTRRDVDKTCAGFDGLKGLYRPSIVANQELYRKCSAYKRAQQSSETIVDPACNALKEKYPQQFAKFCTLQWGATNRYYIKDPQQVSEFLSVVERFSDSIGLKDNSLLRMRREIRDLKLEGATVEDIAEPIPPAGSTR